MDLVQALRNSFGHIDCGVYAKVVQGGTLRPADTLTIAA
jgi:MOSC domain-containing protein YiiM